MMAAHQLLVTLSVTLSVSVIICMNDMQRHWTQQQQTQQCYTNTCPPPSLTHRSTVVVLAPFQQSG
jgi:hypothetical protein